MEPCSQGPTSNLYLESPASSTSTRISFMTEPLTTDRVVDELVYVSCDNLLQV
jgi:hypothetical protein